jgi:hypothetical protein
MILSRKISLDVISGEDGGRTHDLGFMNPLLCQLSYLANRVDFTMSNQYGQQEKVT